MWQPLLLLAASSSLCFGWVVPHAAIRQPIRAQPVCVRRGGSIELKKSPDEAPEERPEIQFNANSIVEFNGPKHGNGAAPPSLGIVQGVSGSVAASSACVASALSIPLLTEGYVCVLLFARRLQVEYKAKGGARIQIMDVGGSMHTVPEKDIHINLGVYKGKLVEPAEILDDYTKVMEMETGALGVDPELLESEPS